MSEQWCWSIPQSRQCGRQTLGGTWGPLIPGMSALISFEFSMSLWPPWRQENTAEPVFVLCVVWHAASDCDLCSAQRFSSLGALMDQLLHDLPYGWFYPEGIWGPQCNCLQETESHPHLLSDHGSGSSLRLQMKPKANWPFLWSSVGKGAFPS